MFVVNCPCISIYGHFYTLAYGPPSLKCNDVILTAITSIPKTFYGCLTVLTVIVIILSNVNLHSAHIILFSFSITILMKSPQKGHLEAAFGINSIDHSFFHFFIQIMQWSLGQKMYRDLVFFFTRAAFISFKYFSPQLLLIPVRPSMATRDERDTKHRYNTQSEILIRIHGRGRH